MGAAENQDELKRKYIKKIRQMCGREGNWLREKMFHKFTADELRDMVRHIEDAQLEAIDEYKRMSRQGKKGVEIVIVGNSEDFS